MLRDFKAFVMRGNVVDLAVGIVIGVAFATLIGSLVNNMLTPLFAIPGEVDFSDLSARVGGGTFKYGQFLNDLISFVIIAAAVFFFVVRPLNALVNRQGDGSEPSSDVKECQLCLSTIPTAAKRCAFCTGDQ